MLFNSFEFIFAFLPVTIIVYFWLNRLAYKTLSHAWLVLASLFFYSWWNVWNLPIISASILFNYFVGELVAQESRPKSIRKLLLLGGIFINLGTIGYYKYAGFFTTNVNALLNLDIQLSEIVLPLGISFFTFQQIAYLVDAYRGETKEYDFIKYCLFVTFFPQLIAGPIVHHKEIIPQLEDRSQSTLINQQMSVGLTVFVVGLFKKVVIADTFSSFANMAFGAASGGVDLSFSESWVGALSYTIQLYFDFSGYSDMAMGAAYMMGVRLPLNFHSPYQAISIIDFWRRWHITLSNFLRDYLYIPLGGSRQGELRRYSNLLLTMLLGGLWHGAGWQFVLWGGLHGVYLVINHAYRALRKSLGYDLQRDHWFLKGIGWITTFFVVVVAWVFFRADSIATASSILKSMLGFNGIQIASFLEGYLGFLRNFGVTFDGFTVNVGLSQKYTTLGIPLMLLITFISPTLYELMGKYSPALGHSVNNNSLLCHERFLSIIRWRPNKIWSVIVGMLTATSLLCFTRVSEFLYFQF